MTSPRWRKSSRSSGSGETNCVEVAGLRGLVAVRDSKDLHGPVLAVAPEDWRAFTDRVKVDALGLG